MLFWTNKPILKILVSFIFGIAFYGAFDLYVVLTISITTILLLTLRKFSGKFLQYKFRAFYGLLAHILIMATGLLDMYIHDIRVNKMWFGNDSNNKQLIVKVNGPAKRKNKNYQATAEVLYIIDENNWRRAAGNLQVHFPIAIDPPYHNDIYYLQTDIQPIPPPKNPGFDYRSFMALKNIYHNCYPEKSRIKKLTGQQKVPSFYAMTDSVRRWILGIIDRYISNPSENGLAKALLIGYRDNLDKEIITAYTNTGVIHVIAISGLHLGLIYALLAWILKFSRKNNYLRTSRSVFIAAFLWIFSILCGASPSVLRSALMFTCLLAGEALQKENYTANALAGSAFILLCIDPKLLWDIGFQLSYAAVGSLLIYNQWIGRIYQPGNPVIAFAWNSVSTSISAQVLTTPLILYHFHQFPVLFILANLVAVPLSGIILLLLIMLCILSPFPPAAGLLALFINWLSALMNSQISRLNDISFAVITNIGSGLKDTILLYACIVLLTAWLNTKKPWAVFALLALVLLWSVI